MSEREMTAPRIVITVVKLPGVKRRPWDHPRYQEWLRKSYEDVRRTVERLNQQ